VDHGPRTTAQTTAPAITEDGSVFLSPALRRQPAAPAVRTACPPRVSANDVALAAAVLLIDVLLAALLPAGPDSHRPGALGWALLVVSAAVLAWRRRAPLLCLIGMVAVVAPYHAMENPHGAPLLSSGPP